jgi:hypothetical protein
MGLIWDICTSSRLILKPLLGLLGGKYPRLNVYLFDNTMTT